MGKINNRVHVYYTEDPFLLVKTTKLDHRKDNAPIFVLTSIYHWPRKTLRYNWPIKKRLLHLKIFTKNCDICMCQLAPLIGSK